MHAGSPDVLNRGIWVKCGRRTRFASFPGGAATVKRKRNGLPRVLRTLAMTAFPEVRKPARTVKYQGAVSYKEPRNPVKERCGVALPCRAMCRQRSKTERFLSSRAQPRDLEALDSHGIQIFRLRCASLKMTEFRVCLHSVRYVCHAVLSFSLCDFRWPKGRIKKGEMQLSTTTKKILAVILLLAAAAAVAFVYSRWGSEAQKRAELARRKAARQARTAAAITEEAPTARALSLLPGGGSIEFE